MTTSFLIIYSFVAFLTALRSLCFNDFTSCSQTVGYNGTERKIIKGEKELGLINLKFPDKVQLLNDPNIWIGDTEATVHMTSYSVGMIPRKNQNENNEEITLRNGTQEKTIMQGIIKGNLVNKNGA